MAWGAEEVPVFNRQTLWEGGRMHGLLTLALQHPWVHFQKSSQVGLLALDLGNQPPQLPVGPDVILLRDHRAGGAQQALPTGLFLQGVYAVEVADVPTLQVHGLFKISQAEVASTYFFKVFSHGCCLGENMHDY